MDVILILSIHLITCYRTCIQAVVYASNLVNSELGALASYYAYENEPCHARTANDAYIYLCHAHTARHRSHNGTAFQPATQQMA